MKKIIFLLFSMVFFCFDTQAQKKSNGGLAPNESKEKSGASLPVYELNVDGNAVFNLVEGLSGIDLYDASGAFIGLLRHSADPNGTMYLSNFSGSDGELQIYSEGSVSLYSNSLKTLTADNANNVGIGTSTPSAKLHATGTSGDIIYGQYTGGASDDAGVRGENFDTDYIGYGVYGIGGWRGVYGVVNPTGNSVYTGVRGQVSGGSGTNYAVYGFASGTGTNYAGYFSGDVTVTGTFNNPSDAKLKTAVKSMGGNVLSKINSLQTKEYTYKTDEYSMMNLPKGKQTGFIAQEVQAIFPNLVKKNVHAIESEDNNGVKTNDKIEFLGVNYTGLIPILTTGIQELSTENTELKTEVTDLKTRLAQLEAIVKETRVRS